MLTDYLDQPLEYAQKVATQKVATSLLLKSLQLYLVVQGEVQLEHNSHTVNVSVEATC